MIVKEQNVEEITFYHFSKNKQTRKINDKTIETNILYN